MKPLFFSLFFSVLLFIGGTTHLVMAQGGRPPSPVEVVEVQEQTLIKPLLLVGTVEPRTQSTVASEVEGLVKFFPIEEGNKISRGDLLARLGTDTLRIQLKAAEAAREESNARQQQAVSNLKRSKRLFEENLLSEKDLENDEAEAEAWSQKKNQYQAEIDRLQDLINKSKILAPFSGEITQTHTEVGQWLQKGGSVAEIIDLEHVRIKIPLPEKYIGNIQIGNVVQVTLDALPNRIFSGKVHAIISQADPESRTFPIKIDLENKLQELKSGLLARVSLSVGPPIKALTVPKDALVIRGENISVYVASKGDTGWTVSPIPVQTGLMIGNVVEISGPIKVGEKVVIRGNERLRPGQAVHIMEKK